MAEEYFESINNNLKYLSNKYGYHWASIARRLRGAGHKLRTNSESQIELRTGEQHPNYKHGFFIGTQNYKRQMKDIKQCEQCGKNKDLLVHHLDHDHYNNDRENLVKLCRSCHTVHHNKIRGKNDSQYLCLA